MREFSGADRGQELAQEPSLQSACPYPSPSSSSSGVCWWLTEQLQMFEKGLRHVQEGQGFHEDVYECHERRRSRHQLDKGHYWGPFR